MAAYSKLELTPRLQLLADWVRPGARLADVGTDHGYLPLRLIRQGKVSHAVASDLRPGPLSRARENAAAYGVSEQLDLRLCNGLAKIRAEEADTVTIAGMGGENIAQILAAAPWTADGKHTLLLQPQSRAEVLRTFLMQNGYSITREQLVEDRGTLYTVLEAVGGSMQLTPGQIYAGAYLNQDPLGDRWLIEKILRLMSAIAGLHRSTLPEDPEKVEHLRRLATSLMEMREEWRHANSKTD